MHRHKTYLIVDDNEDISGKMSGVLLDRRQMPSPLRTGLSVGSNGPICSFIRTTVERMVVRGGHDMSEKPPTRI